MKFANFIGGERVDAISAGWLSAINPANGQEYAELADSDQRDIEKAVQAAEKAFPAWSVLTAQARSQFLYKIADMIDEKIDLLARAETQDQGKPYWLAKRLDIPRAAANFRFFAGSILHQEDLATQVDAATMNYVVRAPIGVAGLISPWNLPLYLLTWKIAPAIAFGNTCVAKPSELTSHTASLLCDIFAAVGLPPGVVNMVFGTGLRAGQALVEHPRVPLISFTGGTATGETVARAAASQIKRLSLELGGKNPNIIFDDADLDRAIEESVRSSFLNQGEICLCGSRIYVQRNVHDRFLEKFVEKAKALKVGDPFAPENLLGPLVSKQHLEKVMSYIDIAKSEGVVIACGGTRAEVPDTLRGGYYMRPTVLLAPASTSRLQQEEIFGPVVTVTPFDSEEEVIGLANSVKYGLSATIWTTNLKRAHGVGHKLNVGTVWVNTWMNRDLRVPFGGAKMSGLGREGQRDSLEFFTSARTICVRHTL